jgi:hypothetical protein
MLGQTRRMTSFHRFRRSAIVGLRGYSDFGVGLRNGCNTPRRPFRGPAGDQLGFARTHNLAAQGTSFGFNEERRADRWKTQWRTIIQFGDGVCFLGITAAVAALRLKRVVLPLRWQRAVDTHISRNEALDEGLST